MFIFQLIGCKGKQKTIICKTIRYFFINKYVIVWWLAEKVLPLHPHFAPKGEIGARTGADFYHY